MIDPHRLHLAIVNQRSEQPVRLVENFLVLDVQPGERIDVEEPAVIDLVRRSPPVCQAVGLRLRS